MTLKLLLVKNSADVNLCTMKGGYPLRIAINKGYKSIEQILLDNGANEN